MNENNLDNIFGQEADATEADATEADADEVFDDNDEVDEVLWGGSIRHSARNNTIIMPVLREIRLREENTHNHRHNHRHNHPHKYSRNNSGKRVRIKQTTHHNYLQLQSGEELYFKEEDGKNILLNGRTAFNRLVRNIISKLPNKISERLKFLAKLLYEEYNENNIFNLRDTIYKAYITEYKLRFIFKRLLIQWRVYKMNKLSNKELDPITLAEPEKEVHIYDWSVKKLFIFDAKSIAILIETKLMYSEYGFPVPMYPKNPCNNLEFSYKQLVSIYNQLKVHGELRWCLVTFKEQNFNKHKWYMYNKSAVTIKAIKNNIILLDSCEARDQFSDFIFSKIDELGYISSAYITQAYRTAMIKIPTHWYLEKFKSLAMSHYEAVHFGYNRSSSINTLCKRLLNKQDQFIRELILKHII